MYKVLFSRVFVLGLLLAFQLFWYFYLINYLGNYGPTVSIIVRVIAFIVVFYLVGLDMDAGFKITWIIIILSMPIIGLGIFIMIGNNKKLSRHIKGFKDISKRTHDLYSKNYDYSNLNFPNEIIKKEANYLNKFDFLSYKHTAVEYYPSGEELKAAMLRELKVAKKFIFLEYFIIKDGEFWNDILKVLEKKAQEGVEVRVMYDDFGCALTLRRRYYEELILKGIKCTPFNQLSPFFSTRMQNRDHRKICIIDGDISFTGGINIGDEYINKEKRFGRWKDTAVKLTGPATWSFTLMFLQNWNTMIDEDKDFEIYRPNIDFQPVGNHGYVAPFGSSPMSIEPIGRNVYINLINQAKKYVYMTTPYLILDNATKDALILAAKNGVDVRIITPGIYDKKLVSLLTKDNYHSLIDAGVKIYEYTPGFIHAKMMISDNEACTLGTVNLDYRSFYHHFECGVVIGSNEVIKRIYDDIVDTQSISKEITKNELNNNIFKKVIVLAIRLIAPLM